MMKQKTITLLGIALAAATAASCGSGASSETNAASDGVRNFNVSLNMKSAERFYRTVLAGDTIYIDQSATIQWPETLGDFNLSTLRDTIVSLAFSAPAPATAAEVTPDIDKLILDNVSDMSMLGDSLTYETLDSLPSAQDIAPYYSDVTASILEFNDKLVTYQVSHFIYTGGAHPNSNTQPFTYDLVNGRVLNVGNMFRTGSEKEVISIVQNSLARQLGIQPSQLESAGIFLSQFTSPGMPYINNDVIVFHFNPYDIAPYSMGNIDVAVYPYELNEYLTPEVKALLDE